MCTYDHRWNQLHFCLHRHTVNQHLCSYHVIGSGDSAVVTKSCPTLVTPWTVACQAPWSMGFSRQEY